MRVQLTRAQVERLAKAARCRSGQLKRIAAGVSSPVRQQYEEESRGLTKDAAALEAALGEQVAA